MLMILARLVRSESFWAVVKVRPPHTGPEVSYPRHYIKTKQSEQAERPEPNALARVAMSYPAKAMVTATLVNAENPPLLSKLQLLLLPPPQLTPERSSRAEHRRQ